MSYVERHVVAIISLATPVEAEAKALAADLGSTPYETRLKLTAGLPAIVMTTTDAGAAKALVGSLRGRGHRALAVAASSVVPAARMISMRHFQLDDDGLDTGDAQLPWSDISALVRARHRRTTETVERVTEKKFDLGRAVATGGMIMRKTHKSEVVTRSEDSEQVLYLFRASGDTPWLLREHATSFAGLGAALKPTASQNFAIAVETFRGHAPHARFDDSLLRRPTVTDVDLYAHVLAVS